MSSASAASSVCQGLKSCLEPLTSDSMGKRVLTEWGLSPLVPRKQTEAPCAGCSKHGLIAASYRNDEDSMGRWVSIQSLTSVGKLFDGEGGDQVYIHPLVGRSVSSLSMESLEMCTESLGCETGSSIVELGIDEPSYQERPSRAARTPNAGVTCRKAKQGNSFPPPLTSISGSDGLKVQTRREGGRLVIKAFALPSIGPCFQAERENGRLRLHLVKEGCLNGGGHESGEDGEEKDTMGNRDRAENDGNEDEFDAGFWEGKVGCKVGNGEWSGSSRCNGDSNGSKRLPSLPFCVAIS